MRQQLAGGGAVEFTVAVPGFVPTIVTFRCLAGAHVDQWRLPVGVTPPEKPRATGMMVRRADAPCTNRDSDHIARCLRFSCGFHVRVALYARGMVDLASRACGRCTVAHLKDGGLRGTPCTDA